MEQLSLGLPADASSATTYRPPQRELDDLIERALASIGRVFDAGHAVINAWSAGKDSSVCLALTLEAAQRAQARGNHPRILVTHSSTGIENPEVEVLAREEMRRIRRFARERGIDLTVRVAHPALNDTWAVTVISGRRLPTFANSSSRDCSVNMKVRPMDRLRRDLLSSLQEGGHPAPVTLLGTRFEESPGRRERMIERGERADAVRESPDGALFLSPIADWTSSDVWEYLGRAQAGEIQTYSTFEETFRIYRDSGGSSCAVVSDMATEGMKQSRACGARTGCAVCTAVGRDASLENMIETDPRYAYMRGLNRLQRFLVNTQYDLSRRYWLARTIDEEGFLSIQPDVYSPAMQEELLRYCLSLDYIEQRAAAAEGIAPRFRLVNERQLIAIDAQWSLQGFHRPFHALLVHREVEQGKLSEVPEVPRFPKVSMAPVGRLYVGPRFDGDDPDLFTGMRDPLYAEFGCHGSRTLKDGRQVPDLELSEFFNVEEESAILTLDFERDWLISKYHDQPDIGRTAAYIWYLHAGVITLTPQQVVVVDQILRRTAYRERVGVAGESTLESLTALAGQPQFAPPAELAGSGRTLRI